MSNRIFQFELNGQKFIVGEDDINFGVIRGIKCSTSTVEFLLGEKGLMIPKGTILYGVSMGKRHRFLFEVAEDVPFHTEQIPIKTGTIMDLEVSKRGRSVYNTILESHCRFPTEEEIRQYLKGYGI